MLRWAIVVLVLASVQMAATTTCTGQGSGAGSCACDGTACTKVTLSNMNITNGICYWTNLAGQTPDGNAYQNSPHSNNFACNPTTNPADTECSSATTVTDSSNDYYALVAAGNGTEVAAQQALTYYTAFNRALSRYNCEEQYSHWNCDDCRKAYARWACAMTLPKCLTTPCSAVKPCENVCFEVVRKCPVTLGFTCPTDNRDYSTSGCNSMGILSGATTTVPATMTMAVLSMAMFLWGQAL